VSAVIGVVALQGGVRPHLEMLGRLGLAAREVRGAAELPGLSGLVLPGGESTAQGLLLERFGLGEALDDFVHSGRPLLATCAGLVLSAKRGWLELDLVRNGFGSQLHSFEAESDGGGHRLVFIRAPRIARVGASVEVVVRYRSEAVAVRRGSLWAASFHPELTDDPWLHRRVFGSVL